MSNLNLTWQDIFVDPSSMDFAQLLTQWPNTVSGKLRPLGASVFGDCFFERPSGQIEKLDVLQGGVHVVAGSMEDFKKLVNTVNWQQQALLTQGVALLIERGVIRLPSQFYVFTPHPAFTGTVNWDTVTTLDARVWHSICAEILDVPRAE